MSKGIYDTETGIETELLDGELHVGWKKGWYCVPHEGGHIFSAQRARELGYIKETREYIIWRVAYPTLGLVHLESEEL